MPVGAAWKPDGVTAAAASQFVDVLAQTCAMENGESRAPEIELKQLARVSNKGVGLPAIHNWNGFVGIVWRFQVLRLLEALLAS